jgi:hypothetical protein
MDIVLSGYRHSSVSLSGIIIIIIIIIIIQQWILTKNYTVFKLRSDLDMLLLYLYSLSHHPENGGMSARNILVAAIQ